MSVTSIYIITKVRFFSYYEIICSYHFYMDECMDSFSKLALFKILILYNATYNNKSSLCYAQTSYLFLVDLQPRAKYNKHNCKLINCKTVKNLARISLKGQGVLPNGLHTHKSKQCFISVNLTVNEGQTKNIEYDIGIVNVVALLLLFEYLL